MAKVLCVDGVERTAWLLRVLLTDAELAAVRKMAEHYGDTTHDQLYVAFYAGLHELEQRADNEQLLERVDTDELPDDAHEHGYRTNNQLLARELAEQPGDDDERAYDEPVEQQS